MVLRWILHSWGAFVSWLSLKSALRLGRALGWIYGSVIRYHRQDAIDALTRSFPEKNKKEILRIVSDMYANLGMNLIELCRLRKMNHDYFGQFIDVEGLEHVQDALDTRGKGALILTAHFGNWDLLCTVTPSPIIGFPITVITKEIKQKVLHDFWIATREKYGVKFVPKQNSYRRCLSALKKNELIGFILDQNMIDKEGVFVDFFGKPACTSPGLAFMSAQSKAPVIPAFIVRKPNGHHRVNIYPPIEPPKDRTPESIQAATQQYTKVIEDNIKKHPEQWIWLHRRWKTQPKANKE